MPSWLVFCMMMFACLGKCAATCLQIALLVAHSTVSPARCLLMSCMDESSLAGRHALPACLQYAFLVAHWAACIFYFIARQYDFSSNTWVGANFSLLGGLPAFQR